MWGTGKVEDNQKTSNCNGTVINVTEMTIKWIFNIVSKVQKGSKYINLLEFGGKLAKKSFLVIIRTMRKLWKFV